VASRVRRRVLPGHKRCQASPIDLESCRVTVGNLDTLIELLDGLRVAAFLTEHDSHRFVAVNERGRPFLDSSAGALLGTDVFTC
jgi:hypothetical protein